MKKYVVAGVAVLVAIAVTWSTFARAQDQASQRQNMRERFQNMSEEERAKFREQMRARGGGSRRAMISPEDQQKAIKTIEAQLAKLKAAAQIQVPQGGFQDMSEEERTKITTAFRDRRTALQTIVAQVALLEGRTQPEGQEATFMIISTADLAPIQESATKEKAEETSQLLQRLMARGSGRGFGGGRGGSGQRPEGGQRRQQQQ